MQLAELPDLFDMISISHDHMIAYKVGNPLKFINGNFYIRPATACWWYWRTTDDSS